MSITSGALPPASSRSSARGATVATRARAASKPKSADGTVSVGDVVTVDLGDGPETYLLGSVDEAADGVDVITPSSPLGKVLQGASVGSTLSYAPRAGRSLNATVIAVA